MGPIERPTILETGWKHLYLVRRRGPCQLSDSDPIHSIVQTCTGITNNSLTGSDQNHYEYSKYPHSQCFKFDFCFSEDVCHHLCLSMMAVSRLFHYGHICTTAPRWERVGRVHPVLPLRTGRNLMAGQAVGNEASFSPPPSWSPARKRA